MADYGDAARAYRTTAEAAMSPCDAAVSLHEGLCRELFAAKAAYERRALDQMCTHTARCSHVLLELRAGLKPQDGDPGVVALDQLYLKLFLGIMRVLRVKDPAQHLQGLIDLLWKLSQKMRVEREALERTERQRVLTGA